MVFIQFALKGFSTNVLGGKIPALVPLWITVITLTTIITFSEIALQIIREVWKKKKENRDYASDAQEGANVESDSGTQIQLQVQPRSLHIQTRRRNATKESPRCFIGIMLALLIVKVLFQNGGSALVGLLIFLSCTVKESTTDNTLTAEIHFILLLVSWGINGLPALLTIIKIGVIIFRKRQDKWGIACLRWAFCFLVSFATIVAAFFFFLFAIYLQAFTTDGRDWLLKETEMTLYTSTLARAFPVISMMGLQHWWQILAIYTKAETTGYSNT